MASHAINPTYEVSFSCKERGYWVKAQKRPFDGPKPTLSVAIGSATSTFFFPWSQA